MKKLPLLLLATALFCSAWAADYPTFAVTARDGKLLPPRLEVPAGQRLKLTLANQGVTPVEFENLDLRVEKVLGPGAQSFVIVPALRPGEYKFIDEFHAATGVMWVVAK